MWKKDIGFFTLLMIVLLAVLWPMACVPPNPNALSDTEVQIDLNNPEVQKLYNFKDKRQVDSLIPYMASPKPALRYIAALAFASIKDTNYINDLALLLRDPVNDVRIAAALALGLTGHPKAEPHLLKAFVDKDSASAHQPFNAVILEAIGRCGAADKLPFLGSVVTYLPTDTALLVGQCKAVYRYALRGMTDGTATQRMADYIVDLRIPQPARLMAAHYFGRAKLALDSTTTQKLEKAFWQSKTADVRMAIARGLGKSAQESTFSTLTRALNTERDYRVRCELIRALGNFAESKRDTIRNLVYGLTLDTNQHVSHTAASFFVKNGHPYDGDKYWRFVRESMPWQTQVELLRASNKWLSPAVQQSKDFLTYKIREQFKKSRNPYERAACLTALGEYVWQYRWIHDKGYADENPIVKSAAAAALQGIAESPVYDRYFGESRRYAKRELYSYFIEAIETRDVGMIYHAAQALRNEERGFSSMVDSTQLSVIQAALKDLKSPRDIESKRELEATFALFQGKVLDSPKPPKYNHTIAWEILRTIQARSQANIETEKGTIRMEFLPIAAPGSTCNFIDLAQKDFFNGKAFHRVIPNFVAQGGCTRGDGFGALDYSIRTEISEAVYNDSGWIGMASAGADTEGTQFFITHSPTPHLDGNYTIFAKVISGMDIVHKLQVGDKIERVSIKF